MQVLALLQICKGILLCQGSSTGLQTWDLVCRISLHTSLLCHWHCMGKRLYYFYQILFCPTLSLILSSLHLFLMIHRKLKKINPQNLLSRHCYLIMCIKHYMQYERNEILTSLSHIRKKDKEEKQAKKATTLLSSEICQTIKSVSILQQINITQLERSIL